jgi:hypothetical protein
MCGDDLGMLTGRHMVRDPDQSRSLEASKSLITRGKCYRK